jgi:hypothetical protein
MALYLRSRGTNHTLFLVNTHAGCPRSLCTGLYSRSTETPLYLQATINRKWQFFKLLSTIFNALFASPKQWLKNCCTQFFFLSAFKLFDSTGICSFICRNMCTHFAVTRHLWTPHGKFTRVITRDGGQWPDPQQATHLRREHILRPKRGETPFCCQSTHSTSRYCSISGTTVLCRSSI